MNSRQRVKHALNFTHPDRVPISHAVLPAAQIKYGKALDEILTEFREDFGWDYMQDLPLADFPAVYKQGSTPVITLDLGAPTPCGAFSIDIGGYPSQDAIKGQVKDKVELLVSLDDKDYKSLGFYDFNLRWKDLPLNVPFNDDETFQAHNLPFIPPQPVMARYVRWVLTPARMMTVSEVQVWDSIKIAPFDMKIALPDGKDRSDITQYNPKHTPSKPYKPVAAAAAE